jgi:hypothetical protein
MAASIFGVHLYDFSIISRCRRFACWCAIGAALAWPAVCAAQSAALETPGVPIPAEPGFLQSRGAQPRFEAANKLTAETAAAVRRQQISSVPHFYGAFAFEGRTFPFTLVGANPQAGGTTRIPTQVVAVSLFFEDFVDEKGDPLVLGPSPILQRVLNSPNFRIASYTTGDTQFADAVQRAQFFRIMAQDWHTLLGTPEVLRPVVIDVPRGMAKVYRNTSTGAVYALVNTAFFVSHLNTIVQLEDLRPDALPILLTSNVFLDPDLDMKRCCVLGFHTAFETGPPGKAEVQTLIWASWIDPGVMGSGVADVTPLSHEISEWMNNPFGTNIVPAWQSPAGTGVCQSNLETADPVATLPDAGIPVNIDDFTFHPHNQVLLSWFTRQSASDSIEGAFSFPNQGLITRPSQPCSH